MKVAQALGWLIAHCELSVEHDCSFDCKTAVTSTMLYTFVNLSIVVVCVWRHGAAGA